MNKKKNIGIWGFGVVGRSAARYFSAQGFSVQIFEPSWTPLEKKKRTDQKPQTSFTSNLEDFLQNNDKILPSPGIDLRPYKKYQHKWITEVDIIEKNFKKPIVAITGTVGKTSVTHLLSDLLKKNGLKVWTGGNIGVGMLDLLLQKKKIDLAILELSSFQLEQSKKFAPDLAIWTNFSENHLDRHGTIQQYFAAKRKIFEQQKKGQYSILPLSIKGKLEDFQFLSTSLFFSSDYLTEQEPVMRHVKTLFQFLPPSTFFENRLIVSLAAHVISKKLDKKIMNPIKSRQLEHRLEKVGEINGTTFFNDSKSTTPASTLAALQKLSDKPVFLFLGGLDKGINRTPLFDSLEKNIKKLFLFGKQAQELAIIAKKKKHKFEVFYNLDSAFAACLKHIKPGDTVLFSPAGSSFDLFKNYKERGNYFKKLIKKALRHAPCAATTNLNNSSTNRHSNST